MVLVYDIYVRNIDRVVKDHHQLSLILAEQITKWVREHKLYNKLGKVIIVKIPDTGDPELYETLNTCYGFIQFEKYWNHHWAVQMFNNKWFKNKRIKMVVNKKPTMLAQMKGSDHTKVKIDQHSHTEKINYLEQIGYSELLDEKFNNDQSQNNSSDEEFEVINREDLYQKSLYESFYNENWDLLFCDKNDDEKELNESSDESESTISQVTVIHIKDLEEGEDEMVLSYDDLTQELEYESKKLTQAENKVKELEEILKIECQQKDDLKQEVKNLKDKTQRMKTIMEINESKCVEYKFVISKLQAKFEEMTAENKRLAGDKSIRGTFIKKIVIQNSQIFNKYGELLVEVLNEK